ncbi:Carbohydrate esterase 4 protein [Mortierella sp. AD011]|nr:Carbohydrate esterase 4 protein [Mortierella sp. AD011]
MATIHLVSPYWALVLAGAQSTTINESRRDIVNILDAAGAKATFFVPATYNDRIYSTDAQKRLKYVYAHSHQIGSSTWSYRDMTTLSEQEIIDKASKTTVCPPYGSYKQWVQDVMSSRCQAIALRDMKVGDSTGATPDQSKVAIDKIASKAPNNIFVELLEIETTAQVVLPYAIENFHRFHSRNALRMLGRHSHVPDNCRTKYP